MTFTDEIVEEWQKRTGKPRELLEEMLRIHADYIYEKSVNDSESFRIHLPNLATLNFNFFASDVGEINYKEDEPLLRSIQQKRIKLIENYTTDEVNFLQPQCYTEEKREIKRLVKKTYFKMKDLYDKMAQKSNEKAIKCYSE